MKISESNRSEIFRASRVYGRIVRAATGLSVIGALSLLGSGCSVETGALQEPDTGTETQALHENAWRNWSSREASTAINDEPTICSNTVGYVVGVRNSDQRYYLKRTSFSTNPNWKQFGTKTFSSPPSCSMQYAYPDTNPLFLLAGKGTDNRIYVIEGTLPTATDLVPPNPDWTGPWAQVSSSEFSGSSNGRPALGTNNSRVVLTYLNNNRIYARYRNLPYGSNSWSSVVTAPQFPAGVTVTGIPAITYVRGSTNRFTIMVRGTNAGATGLYWIYFTGTAFQGSWGQAFIPGTISSDPAMEYDTVYNALTLYYRSGNEVIQTSVAHPGELGSRPFWPIPNLASTTVLGAPRVVFGGGIEGNRAAVIRGHDSAIPTANKNRGHLLAEVFHAPSPW